jgi:hypothetical protein
LRPLLLVLTAAVSAIFVTPAAPALGQWYPPMGAGYGMSPFMGAPSMGGGMTVAPPMGGGMTVPSIDPNASCQQALAQAAYPIANQMVTFATAANAYPMTPNGRPVIAPTFAYPGFFGFAGPGRSFGAANGLLASNLRGLNNFPPGTTPAAVLNALAGAPGGLTLPALGAGDLLGVAGLYQGQVGNILGAIDTQQGVLGTRFAAAELNASFTAFPREQAALLKEVIEGLTLYRDLACPPSEGGAGGGNHNNNNNNNNN